MKTKLLLAALLGSCAMSAQTTHVINWFMNVSDAAASMTIEQGDIVQWIWTDNLPHTVSSNGGAESFDSGMLTGNGQTFSHTFTDEGATTYQCNVHPMMNGTITVQPTAGVENTIAKELQFYPNPTTNIFTVTAQENIDTVKVFDVNGRLMLESAAGTPTVKLYMDKFTAGTYFVKVNAGNTSKTIQVVKQ